MNKEQALEFTKDRIEKITRMTYKTESEIKIKRETLEYLRFIESLLENKEDRI
jgi:hypothetical protein